MVRLLEDAGGAALGRWYRVSQVRWLPVPRILRGKIRVLAGILGVFTPANLGNALLVALRIASAQRRRKDAVGTLVFGQCWIAQAQLFTGRGTGSLFGPFGFSLRQRQRGEQGACPPGPRGQSHVRGEKGVSKNPQPSLPRKLGQSPVNGYAQANPLPVPEPLTGDNVFPYRVLMYFWIYVPSLGGDICVHVRTTTVAAKHVAMSLQPAGKFSGADLGTESAEWKAGGPLARTAGPGLIRSIEVRAVRPGRRLMACELPAGDVSFGRKRLAQGLVHRLDFTPGVSLFIHQEVPCLC